MELCKSRVETDMVDSVYKFGVGMSPTNVASQFRFQLPNNPRVEYSPYFEKQIPNFTRKAMIEALQTTSKIEASIAKLLNNS